MGPKAPCSTVLTMGEEAVVVAFRKHASVSRDDCLYALQATIPHLTRSSPHRCLQRQGISRLPDIEGDKPGKTMFESCPIGFFHTDIAQTRRDIDVAIQLRHRLYRRLTRFGNRHRCRRL